MMFQFQISNVRRTAFALSLYTGLVLPSFVTAQEETTILEQPPAEVLEEIVVEGRKIFEGHDGMEAFWAGDYEKAEIEFELDFKSLKRGRSGTFNAAVDAQLGASRAGDLAATTSTQSQVNGNGSGAPQILSNSSNGTNISSSNNFSNKRVKGKNLLNDGKITDLDFAFTKYMSGLSELQQGKYAEAKDSLKTSIFYDRSNVDARMRLGLLYIVEGNIQKSADQLEAIEKIRVKCKKQKKCSEYDAVVEAASTLAKSITNAINNLN